MSETRTIEVAANGLRFTALETGEGPLLLCLHGFPDDARTFKHQMAPLARAGFRVVAPFMRGYAPSEASDSGVYQTAALGRDVLGLIDALAAGGKATVFGHDWGAMATYAAAILGPDRIDRIITAAVPYGPRLATAFTQSYTQQKRSWYMFFFQTPLAEMAVPLNDFAFIRNLWKDWSPTWHFAEDDIAPVIETLGKPGVLEAAIGYYRSMLNPALQDPALLNDQMRIGLEPVEVPALYLHGADDNCVGLELAEDMETMFPAGLTSVIVDGAGHFVQLEKPQQVTEQVLRFLGK
ncbi:MAG TPA: alpha/beta hydrolase [Candidatus Binatia bacterium]|nr:alpha/beta hydrolase [Candidatus Binatia bacterium]